ncbi:DUF2777 family protein [Bacillus sp. FJAT-47783]|uniref:DUF2777 family protein n=1 Tax=Bacillus sp. FJAT-47783 TaxID=2922712 RepID=UPI001FABD66C
MISEAKDQLLREQKRSYIVGTFHQDETECFLSSEDDEYIPLNEIHFKAVEVNLNGRWKNGEWLGDGCIDLCGNHYELQEGEVIRLKKNLTYCFEQMLEELADTSFIMFIHHLNKLSFSIYDFIYGYNQRMFDHKGASIYVFDNEEKICSVQHVFKRTNGFSDRFEFTLSTGERSIISTFQKE